MRQTEDELTRNMLSSTASAVNCVGGFNGDNPTELTASDVADVTTALIGNDAFMIMDNIEGKVFALVKFLLIDLDAEVAFQLTGNKGQA